MSAKVVEAGFSEAAVGLASKRSGASTTGLYPPSHRARAVDFHPDGSVLAVALCSGVAAGQEGVRVLCGLVVVFVGAGVVWASSGVCWGGCCVG